MRTIVLGPPPAELQTLIARRHSLGLDKRDEVWDGEYHMAPMAHSSHGWLDQVLAELLGPMARAVGLFPTGAFNLGSVDNFRVPDRGLHRGAPDAVWMATVAIAVEIESPDDETWDKLDFYAAHQVDEILVVCAQRRQVTWLTLGDGRYQESVRSGLLGEASKDLLEQIDWPEPPPDN